ncbi:protein kinase [Sphaerimonospora cavernae]|uniref:non-specific serine/threonine protein kinase n=1 Tax=Sphaerimonospora cavernae TaxID=1740611 RepID=A0ABV6U7E3_9ACTN
MTTRRLGEYALIRVIGQGGQGVVHLAESPDGAKVAVKVLHTRFADDDAARKRFIREVTATRQVAPFCTARVLDVDMDGDQPYIVSEYVEGLSLAELVRREGPRDAGGLARLAISTMTALMAIHEAGIVHRDFKPSNVLLGPEGPVVIDFGIAKVLDAASTQSSTVMGTPSYMSPEQVAGASIGPASDIFSWAVTMTYAAAGRPAFGDDSIPAVLNRISHMEPDLIEVPKPLASILTACLGKRPEDRPSDRDVLRALTGGAAVMRLADGQPPTVNLRSAATLEYTKQLEENAPSRPTPRSGPPTPPPSVPPSAPPAVPLPPDREGWAPVPTPSTDKSKPRLWAFAVATVVAVGGVAMVLRALPGNLVFTAAPATTPPAATATAATPSVLQASPIPSLTPSETATASSSPTPSPSASPSPSDSPSTAKSVPEPSGPRERIMAWLRESQGTDAVSQIDGRAIAVSGTRDGWVTAWDLGKGVPFGKAADCRDGDVIPIVSLSVGKIGNHPAVACVGINYRIRVVDLVTGRRLIKPLWTSYYINQLALTELDGRATIVFNGGNNQRLYAFALATPKHLTEMGVVGEAGDGGGYGPSQIIIDRVGRRQVAISAGGYGGVHVVDLHSGRLLSPPFQATNIADDVNTKARTVASAEINGRPVIVSGWADGTIWITDPTNGRPIRKAIKKHVDREEPAYSPAIESVFTAKIDGRWIVISQDAQRNTHVWDLASGKDIKTS